MILTDRLSLLVTITIVFPAAAEPVEMVTDRPDATESSSTVPPGYVQLETGLTVFVTDYRFGDIKTYSFPETLLRFGLDDDWELRLGWSGYHWRRVDILGHTFQDEGAGDPEIGTKVQLREEEGGLPETAFLAHLTLPAGEDGFSSERADPSYRFAFSHTLNETFSLGYNLGQAWVTQEDFSGDRDTLSVFEYTVALGASIDDRTGTFVEFFGDTSTGEGGGPTNWFDGGFTFLLAENVQWDIVSGVGLSDSVRDSWFIGTGLSVRLPN